jgi:hypothetical protein
MHSSLTFEEKKRIYKVFFYELLRSDPYLEMLEKIQVGLLHIQEHASFGHFKDSSSLFG